MAYGSQVANLDAVANIQGLVHEIFTGEVIPGVRWESITAQMYQNAPEGSYRYDGESLNGAIDLLRPSGGQATSGQLPDHMHNDAANWQTTPAQLYVRRAMNNFVAAKAVLGPGSFADLGQRLLDQMWGAFRLMKIRHAIGGADGILCEVAARTSTTVWTAQDGYGHTGTNPFILLDEEMVITHHSTDGGAAEGAGIISTLSTDGLYTVTMAAAWEQTAAVAASDIVCAATTDDPTADYFVSENNLGANGQPQIIDLAGALTTVFGISESTYWRWKPKRYTSGTFDHIEVTEFLQKLESKSTYPVTPESHTLVCGPATYATLARTLVGFQQQMGLGKTFEGGYQAVRIADYELARDPYQVHDALIAYCTEDLYHVNLVEAGYFEDDGSMYQRTSDFDGKEWFVRSYENNFSPARNRMGALTTITHTVDADDFAPTSS